METRELYEAKYQAQIHERMAKLDVVKARAEKMSAQTKLDAKPRLDAMHTRSLLVLAALSLQRRAVSA
jgi:hypothetical protein